MRLRPLLPIARLRSLYVGGASTLDLCAIADETLLQPSAFCIILNPVHILKRTPATKFGTKPPSRLFIGPFLGSLNQPGFSLTHLSLTHIAKSASSVEQVTFLY
jgi:dihydroxyacetone kinase